MQRRRSTSATPTRETRRRSSSATPRRRKPSVAPAETKAAAAAGVAPQPAVVPAVTVVPQVVPADVDWSGFHLYDKQCMHNLASKEYKYTGVDLSPIALKILHPYWNFVVELVPTSIAYVLILKYFDSMLTNCL